jgi:SsrA-binding protein
VPSKLVAVNRKAYHDYHVLEAFEAGIVLSGPEIKSVRAGNVNLRDGYVRIENGEAWLFNTHIARYDAANRFNREPTRPRKLLLHRKQINELAREVQSKGLTLVPLRLYLKDDLAKVEVGLVRGKKQYDKREAEAKREADRDIARAMRREPTTATRGG